MSERLTQMVLDGAPTQELRAAAIAEGMRPLRAAGQLAVLRRQHDRRGGDPRDAAWTADGPAILAEDARPEARCCRFDRQAGRRSRGRPARRARRRAALGGQARAPDGGRARRGEGGSRMAPVRPRPHHEQGAGAVHRAALHAGQTPACRCAQPASPRGPARSRALQERAARRWPTTSRAARRSPRRWPSTRRSSTACT